MFTLRNGDIKPGVGIGKLYVGMSLEELKSIIRDYEVEDLSSCLKLICSDVDLWVHNDKDKVIQIVVKKGFEGKYAGQIGIGSTLADVRNTLGATWHEELDVFVLDNAPGMCYELGDSGDDTYWDELTAPIEYIAVFDIET